MKGVNKIAFYLAAALYFASHYWGYAQEAEIFLLVFGAVSLPYGTYNLLHAKRSPKGEPTPRETTQLHLLRRELYLAIVLFEILLLLVLHYKLSGLEVLSYVIGVTFLVLLVTIFRLWNANCPRCKKHFFRTKKPKANFTVEPGSAGINYSPVQVDITPQCVECGLSWSA